MAKTTDWSDLGPAAQAAWESYPLEYDSPEWQELARTMARKHGVPEDLMLNVLLLGEETDANQVSESGARGPFQFVPGTREKFAERYEIDAWSSPQANAEAAALHLKESLIRNSKLPEGLERNYAAALEYFGGPNWMASKYSTPEESIEYADRVFGFLPPRRTKRAAERQAAASTTEETSPSLMGAAGEPEPAVSDEERRMEDVRAQYRSSLQQRASLGGESDFKAYSLYAKGEMTPELRQQYEEGVRNGAIKLPRGVKELKFGIAAQPSGKANPIEAGPRTMLRYQAALDNDPYVSDRFTDQEMMRFEDQVRRGLVKVPEGFQLRKTAEPGLAQSIVEAVSGKKRATLETETAKDWWDLPEIPSLFSDPVQYAALVAAGPEEAANIIKANAPNVKVTRDDRGNIVFESAMDPGGKYAVKPGVQASDVSRFAQRMLVAAPAAAAGVAATPAALGGLAGLAVGGALGAAGEEAAFQAAQGMTPGGEFNAKDIAISGALGGVLPVAGLGAGRTLGAAAERAAALPIVAPAVGAVRRAAGTAEQAVRGAGVAAAEAVAERARPMALAAQMAQATPTPTTRAPIPAVSRMEQATGPTIEQRLSAMRAAPPGMGAARPIPPAPEAAEFRTAMVAFREAEAQLPKTLPNASLLTGVQAEKIIPAMQRYRDAAAAVSNQQALARADDYLARAKAGMPQPGIMARAPRAPAAAEAATETINKAVPTPLKQTVEDAEDVAEAALATPPLATAISQAEATGIPRGDLIRLVQDASVGGIRGKGREVAVKELAAAINLDPEVVESATRLGIAEFLQPDHVTTDVAIKGLLQAIKTQRASQFGAAEEAGLKSIVNKIQQTFDDYTTKDISEIGADAKSSMVNNAKALEDKADEIYGKVRDTIGGDVQVKATSTLNFLKKRIKERQNNVENLTAMERSLYKKLSPVEVRRVVRGKEQASLVPPTYAMLDDARRMVGEATYRKGVFKDEEQGLAKALYAVLSKDTDRVAKEYDVSGLLKLGKQSISTRKALEDDMLGLMGKELSRSISSAVEEATAGLSKGKADEFVRIVTMVPKEFRKDMLSANLRKIFLQRDGQDALKGARDFARWYGGVKVHKQAMAALYDNIEPGLRQQLDDLYRVYSGILSARSQRAATGITAGFKDDLNAIQYPGGVLARIYQWGRNNGPRAIIRAGVRKVLPMISSAEAGESLLAATLGAPKVKDTVIDAADKLFMSEPFNSLVIKQAVGETITPQQVKTVASSSRFKELAKKLNIPVYQHERWIYSMLGSAGAAESRQAMSRQE